MSTPTDELRELLRGKGLRITAPRLAVAAVLRAANSPLSHTEVLERLGHTAWDPATVYRNLVKLREVGLAPVVSRAGGFDRYAWAHGSQEGHDGHQHPHFVCDDCGQVACLPISVSPTVAVDSPWAASVAGAKVQLRGECPDCLDDAKRQSA